jgi:serine/threonine-protein kinase
MREALEMRKALVLMRWSVLLIAAPLMLGCDMTPANDMDSGGGDSGNADSSNADSSNSDSSSSGSNGLDAVAMGAGGAAVRFSASTIWYEDISSAAIDSQSADVIDWLASNGGWGTGEMRIDFSIEVLSAGADATFRSFIPTDDHYLPDCDLDDVPVPVGGALEGESGYECESDGDCHLIVVDESTDTLYEMWRANIVGDQFFGGCLTVWDLTRDYGSNPRGADCTSADAAGFPIASLLFTAEEVQAGSIDHAIRFILPNARIRNRTYVSPATHSTGATSGTTSAPPYGARFRLRSDYPLETLPSEGARVVARAMQRYGMFLADAGNIALTAQSDRFSEVKWEGLLDTRDLDTISVSDFEMIEAGERHTFTGDCVP